VEISITAIRDFGFELVPHPLFTWYGRLGLSFIWISKRNISAGRGSRTKMRSTPQSMSGSIFSQQTSSAEGYMLCRRDRMHSTQVGIYW
jgi:hypothetical protein